MIFSRQDVGKQELNKCLSGYNKLKNSSYSFES